MTLADDFTSKMQTFALAEHTDGLGRLCECVSHRLDCLFTSSFYVSLLTTSPTPPPLNPSSLDGSSKFDGILGMAFPAISKNPTVDAIIPKLKKDGVIEKAMFAFKLGDETDGELTIGGYDESLVHGEITWIELISPAYWLAKMDTVKFGGKVIASNTAGIMDTGTSLIYGPQDQVMAMAKQVGASYAFQVGLFLLPSCETIIPDLEFTVGGKPITIPGEDLMIKDDTGLHCFFTISIMRFGAEGANILEAQLEDKVVEGVKARVGVQPIPMEYSGNTWLMGDTYLRQFYSIYDYDNKKFGIADLKKN